MIFGRAEGLTARRNGRTAMRYVSTRGHAPELGFSDALLAGLARDGGLYVPKEWPVLSADAASESDAGRPMNSNPCAVDRQ